MIEILRTNDPVLLSFAQDRLKSEGIDAIVLDMHTSVVEGSLGVIPRRLMVPDTTIGRARLLLTEAGLHEELRPQPNVAGGAPEARGAGPSGIEAARWIGLGLIALFALVLAAGSARAVSDDLGGRSLSQAEIAQLLADTYFSGIILDTDTRWSECMLADGTTVYRRARYEANGLWRATAGDRACFRYDDDGYRTEHCFAVLDTDIGVVFVSPDGEVHAATYVERGINSCQAEPELIM